LAGALVGFLVVVQLHFARESDNLDLWPVLNGLISFVLTVVVGYAASYILKLENREKR
jgi:hypothetical protein